MTYGVGQTITAVGRIAAWRIAHGFLQDSEGSILSSFAASDEPFQPEDSGQEIINLMAGICANLILHALTAQLTAILTCISIYMYINV